MTQTLQIERVRDGVATKVNLPYTVESNMSIDQDALRSMLIELLHLRAGDQINESYADQAYIVNTFGYYAPLFTGGMILSNETEEVYDPYKEGWNVAINKTKDKRYVAGADIMSTYSGSDANRGTINKAESYYEETPKKIHAHLVFDFPTHSANAQFDTVTFTPRPLYDNATDTENAIPNLTDRLNSYSKRAYHHMNPKNPIHIDHKKYLPYSSTTGRYAVAEGCILGSVSKKMFFINQEYGYKEAIFDKEEYNSKLAGISDKNGNFTPAYINGKWYVFFTGYKLPVESASSVIQFVEIKNFQVGGDGKYLMTTGTLQTISIPSDFVENLNTTYKATFELFSIVQQGDKTAFLFDPRGTTGGANYTYKGYLLCDSSFNIVKYSKTAPYASFYPGGYYIQGVPQSEHSYGEDVIVVRQPDSPSYYILLDTSANTFTDGLKMSETKKVSHYKYADFGRVYINQLSPTYDMADPQKQYFLMNGSATDSDRRGVFAEPSFKEWMFKFKLNTPMQKTADETLKLTFDITIDI